MKFNHIGIPTTTRFEGEIDLPHLRVTVSDHQSNPFGIQWQRYWADAPYPDLVKTVAHVAFEVDDLDLDVSVEDAVTAVEWGAGLVEQLTDARLEIAISRAEDSEERTVTLSAVGGDWAQRLAALN